MRRVGIVGASGYAGAELLRLLAGHPAIEVAWATGDSQAGTTVARLHPHLAAAYPGLTFERFEPAMAEGVDAVFLALPHGASGSLMTDLRKRVAVVIDLAADFRLRDPALYPAWYGEEHPAPELLGDFAYGLPELHRQELRGASAVAVAGCYPTAAALALAPLVRAGAIEPEGIVVDAASGISGAGRDAYGFCAVYEDFRAYGLVDHRHTPEIEQAIGGGTVLFTPHLAPMSRGILATCYARPAGDADPLALLREAYAAEPFVTVIDEPPTTKAVTGSNTCHVTARRDPRTGWVVVLSAIDNLVKGTSGQAIQCANLAFGLDEGLGLPVVGFAP
jgi:N-acetyl-gamma-glutamyl-phosphate reductase